MEFLFLTKNTGAYIIEFFTNFFGTPALLIGIFALIGCLIQRKKPTEIIVSMFKTIVGFLIIGGGAGIISASIGKFGTAFNLLFERNGYVANNDVIPGIIMDQSGWAWVATAGSLIFIFAMILNLVIARLSGFKYIYLTGHAAWYFSTMVAAVLYFSGLSNEGTDLWMIIVIGSCLVSIYMVLSPAMLNSTMKTITKGQPLAMGHTGSLGYALSGAIGTAVNKATKGKIKDTESVNFPKGLSFLRNTNVSIALTMLILFAIVYFTCWGVRGDQAMIDSGIVGKNDSIIVQGIIQAFTFAAGVEVLLIGVRTFIGELTPAFKGIAEKLVPGAKPAVDCPIVFTFSPNAVIMGFLASALGGFLAFGINIAISSSVNPESMWAAIIVPSIIPHFFTGATSGVFGNAKGGILGCWIAGFVNGLLISFIPYVFIGLELMPQMMDGDGKVLPIIWGDADYILGIIPFYLVKWTTKWGLFALSLLALISLPAIHIILHKVKMNKDEAYKDIYEKYDEIKLNNKTISKEIRETYKLNISRIKEEIRNNQDKEKRKELIKEKEKITDVYYKEDRSIRRNYEKQLKELGIFK